MLDLHLITTVAPNSLVGLNYTPLLILGLVSLGCPCSSALDALTGDALAVAVVDGPNQSATRIC